MTGKETFLPTDKTIFISYQKEVYIALEKHLKEIKYNE